MDGITLRDTYAAFVLRQRPAYDVSPEELEVLITAVEVLDEILAGRHCTPGRHMTCLMPRHGHSDWLAAAERES